jgi:hypothetical protein
MSLSDWSYISQNAFQEVLHPSPMTGKSFLPSSVKPGPRLSILKRISKE